MMRKNRVEKESKRGVQIKDSPELILGKVIISEEGPLLETRNNDSIVQVNWIQ